MKVLKLVLDTHTKLHATDLSLVHEEAKDELKYRLSRLRDLCEEKLTELNA